MTVIARKKQQAVIVARSNGSERLLKVTVVSIEGDQVTLDFELGGSESAHCADEWEQAQAARKAAKHKQSAAHPKSRAAYSD